MSPLIMIVDMVITIDIWIGDQKGSIFIKFKVILGETILCLISPSITKVGILQNFAYLLITICKFAYDHFCRSYCPYFINI